MHLASHLPSAACQPLGTMSLMSNGLFTIPGIWRCGKVSKYRPPERALG